MPVAMVAEGEVVRPDTKKEAQQYIKSLGGDTSYSGKTKTLFYRGLRETDFIAAVDNLKHLKDINIVMGDHIPTLKSVNKKLERQRRVEDLLATASGTHFELKRKK